MGQSKFDKFACENCGQSPHLPWCGRTLPRRKSPTVEFHELVAQLICCFGVRGYPEITVVGDDGTEATLPVTERVAGIVQQARAALRERGRLPVAS